MLAWFNTLNTFVGKHPLNRMAALISKLHAGILPINGCECHILDQPHEHSWWIATKVPWTCLIVAVVEAKHSWHTVNSSRRLSSNTINFLSSAGLGLKWQRNFISCESINCKNKLSLKTHDCQDILLQLTLKIGNTKVKIIVSIEIKITCN